MNPDKLHNTGLDSWNDFDTYNKMEVNYSWYEYTSHSLLQVWVTLQSQDHYSNLNFFHLGKEEKKKVIFSFCFNVFTVHIEISILCSDCRIYIRENKTEQAAF